MDADKKTSDLRSSACICGPFYWVLLGIIAIGAIVIVLLATRWGIATSSDSARYVRAARQLLGREEIVVLPIEAPAQRAHYPPLYSTLMAVLSIGGADPLTAARGLNALLLAANAIFAAELVRRFTGSGAAAVFTAAVIAFSSGTLIVHTFALSEPLFIVFTLGALGLLASYARNPSWKTLIAGAMLTSAAMLTRYAGLSLLLAGMTFILMLAAAPVRSRIVAALAFAALAAAIPLAWTMYNAIALGSATNRVIAWHPVGFRHLIDVAQACWNWLGGDAPVYPALTFLAAACALAVVIAAFAVRNVLAIVLTLFIALTGMVLALSISLIDFHTPLDTRVLSPVYAAWVVLAGSVLAKTQAAGARIRIPVTLIAAALFAWGGVRSFATVQQAYRDGAGYAHRRWRESPTLGALRAIPQDKWIYTNAPGAVYLRCGRTIVITVPSPYSASSRLPNPDFDAEMERMRDDLHSGRAILVYLDRPAASQWQALTEMQLRKRFGLHPVFRRTNDGAIYDYVAPSTTMRAE
jgi:hypothetical protein